MKIESMEIVQAKADGDTIFEEPIPDIGETFGVTDDWNEYAEKVYSMPNSMVCIMPDYFVQTKAQEAGVGHFMIGPTAVFRGKAIAAFTRLCNPSDIVDALKMFEVLYMVCPHVTGEFKIRGVLKQVEERIVEKEDPCPGCEPGVVCRTISCGRLVRK